jgi:hypothetical protein
VANLDAFGLAIGNGWKGAEGRRAGTLQQTTA